MTDKGSIALCVIFPSVVDLPGQKAPAYYGHTMVHYPTCKGMSAMSNPLYHRIYEVVRHIPQGRVATYGQVALVVGPQVTAQQVGEAMAALRDDHPEPPVPWQ